MKQKLSRRPHCLVLPFPSEGYTVPMLQFSKRLKDKGIDVTLLLTCSFFRTLHKSSTISFPIETISDGYDNGGLEEAGSLRCYLARFQQVGSQALTQLLEKKLSTVDCIVYNSTLPWALNVAKKFGLVGAAFFSHSCAADSIYYHIHEGLLKVPIETKRGSKIMVDGLPPLEPADLPSIIHAAFQSYYERFEMFVNQFYNVGKADWLLCNSYYELEKQVAESMAKLWRFRTIGPHVPSKYMDKRLHYDKKYDLHTCKPGPHACIKWLKKQPEASVVYISVPYLGREQMKELAWGIKESNRNFLWEIEASEQANLPKKFLRETSEHGLVVSWSPQLEVLAQRSIGCFVTDCGWNSILEAKSLGVPMVAMPQWSDQLTNAKYVTDVWETGIRADGMGIVRQEVLVRCIKEVMEGERSGQIKKNVKKWRELAIEATGKGGSSDTNIDEFVASLITHS